MAGPDIPKIVHDVIFKPDESDLPMGEYYDPFDPGSYNPMSDIENNAQPVPINGKGEIDATTAAGCFYYEKYDDITPSGVVADRTRVNLLARFGDMVQVSPIAVWDLSIPRAWVRSANVKVDPDHAVVIPEITIVGQPTDLPVGPPWDPNTQGTGTREVDDLPPAIHAPTDPRALIVSDAAMLYKLGYLDAVLTDGDPRNPALKEGVKKFQLKEVVDVNNNLLDQDGLLGTSPPGPLARTREKLYAVYASKNFPNGQPTPSIQNALNKKLESVKTEESSNAIPIAVGVVVVAAGTKLLGLW